MTFTLLAGLAMDGTPDPAVAEQVARAWLAGGLVGLPTETVYGLSADAQDATAVARIYRAKARPADHPVIVHVAGPEALDGWSAAPDPTAHQLAQAFWPGPLTVIVARSSRAGDFITGGQDTVALRCPDHPVALACLRALARASGDRARGVAAPSANRFGRVSPTRAADVVDELGELLDPDRDLVVDGGPCAVGVESTIVDCTVAPPRVLRLGAISQEQVDAVLATPVAQGEPELGAAGSTSVRAPGTLASHYAPSARVVLLEPPAARDIARSAEASSGSPSGLIAEADVPTPAGWTRLASPRTAQEYARVLYASLRRADELGLGSVVVVLPDPGAGPLAYAVRDRLARAAQKQ